MKKRAIIHCILVLLSAEVPAQTDTLHIPSMEEVYRQNSWLTGSNPVGQSFNTFRSFSVARAGYSHKDGNLKNEALPASSNAYSAYSESFQRLGKVALYGKLSYKFSQKHSLSWNNMIDRYWQALNLCDSIRGNQQSEEYRLSGAFSLPVGQQWFIGTRLDYYAGQTAKDTDPRNKNQRMEWQLTPGIAYQRANIRWGASLFYARKKEAVNYSNMGNSAIYPVLVSYPVGFFKTLSRDEVVNWHFSGQEAGGAIQAESTHGTIKLFQQLSGIYFGQAVESDRIKSRKEAKTQGWQIVYKGNIRKQLTHAQHEWGWLVHIEKADNYDPLQQQASGDTWQSYGRVLRSTRNSSQYQLTYGYYNLRDSWHPRYSIVSGVRLHLMESQLFFYPSKFAQPIHQYSVFSTFTRNIPLTKALLDISIGGEYGKGGGSLMKENQASSSEDAPDIKFWQDNGRLQQAYLYETAARWKVQSSITYTRTTPVSWFTRLSGMYIGQNNASYKEIAVHLGLLF